jgi:hypothetical protein
MDWLIACKADGEVIDAIELSNSWPHRSMYDSDVFHFVIATAPEGASRPIVNESGDDGEHIPVFVSELNTASSRDFDTTGGTITCPRVYRSSVGIIWETT